LTGSHEIQNKDFDRQKNKVFHPEIQQCFSAEKHKALDIVQINWQIPRLQ
jgi:hypothetical protein